ncbi:hypothetical protein LTR66_017814 [Elasticomyces elasticus]|nr:hypothetical protein LTR66_017814 [Elasticomyces elasticus]
MNISSQLIMSQRPHDGMHTYCFLCQEFDIRAHSGTFGTALQQAAQSLIANGGSFDQTGLNIAAILNHPLTPPQAKAWLNYLHDTVHTLLDTSSTALLTARRLHGWTELPNSEAIKLQVAKDEAVYAARWEKVQSIIELDNYKRLYKESQDKVRELDKALKGRPGASCDKKEGEDIEEVKGATDADLNKAETGDFWTQYSSG